MKRLPTASAAFSALLALLLATPAHAGVLISGNISDSTTHLFYTASETEAGSASIDFELGRYLRIGYTYGMEISKSVTYKDITAPTTEQPAQNSSGNTYCLATCNETHMNETVISHAVGLTLVLYNGDTFTPFLLAGVIKKTVTIDSLDYQNSATLVQENSTSPEPLGPYAGLGLAIRMSRNFSLKFTYQVSPGYVLHPFDSKLYEIWDRQESAGLQYQL